VLSAEVDRILPDRAKYVDFVPLLSYIYHKGHGRTSVELPNFGLKMLVLNAISGREEREYGFQGKDVFAVILRAFLAIVGMGSTIRS
jgi:hypothetical protein